MKPLIIANWKCNPTTLKGAKLLFNGVKKGIKDVKNVEVVICPPFPYLQLSRSFLDSCIGLGGQNLFYEKKGAFTGEVSAAMLKDIGCKYVIVGHSERKEKDEIVAKKMRASLGAGLKPILCIENEKALKNRLKGINDISKLSVAYEPIWAIGTGKACSPKAAREKQILIRRILTQIYSAKIAEKVRILYGGSITAKNVANYRLDGLLVGSASLDAKEFVKIIKGVSKS